MDTEPYKIGAASGDASLLFINSCNYSLLKDDTNDWGGASP
jgi:hypothetical protein